METFAPTIQQIQQVQITDEQTAVKLIEQAQYNIQANFLKIGEYLHTIAERNLYQEWGYNSLWEFIEAHPKLDFERRTAEMLMRIWRNFGTGSTLPINPKILAEIGYTKCYFLTMLRKEGVLLQSNLQEWIDKALSMKVVEFKREVDKALGKEVDENKNNWVSFSFRVPPESMDKINQAIYAIAKLDNIPEDEIRQKRGELLSKIVEDWMDYYAPAVYNEELSDMERVAFRLKKIKEQIEGLYGQYGVKVLIGSEEPDLDF